MNRFALAASTLSAAVGLALVLQSPAHAADDSSKAMAKEKLEKCYGINASGKNDCAAGSHSCAGQATMARDPKSFVLVPAGSCAKIAGGTSQAM
jgi:uncharacterized membrane protein